VKRVPQNRRRSESWPLVGVDTRCAEDVLAFVAPKPGVRCARVEPHGLQGLGVGVSTFRT
jgi:hypothetical protein